MRTFFLLLIVAVATPCFSQKRHALVVGNNQYLHVEPLTNALNDARAVGTILGATGYRTTFLADARLVDLKRHIERFSEEAEEADTILFFYAGHGVERKGENYILPVDAKVEHPDDLDNFALPLKSVLANIGKSNAKIKMMVLDCCRNNPFPESREIRGSAPGVSQKDLAVGSLLVYAGAPGKAVPDGLIGEDHSPFTMALLSELNRTGRSVIDVFSATSANLKASELDMQYDGETATFDYLNVYPLVPTGLIEDITPPPMRAEPMDAPVLADSFDPTQLETYLTGIWYWGYDRHESEVISSGERVNSEFHAFLTLSADGKCFGEILMLQHGPRAAFINESETRWWVENGKLVLESHSKKKPNTVYDIAWVDGKMTLYHSPTEKEYRRVLSKEALKIPDDYKRLGGKKR